MVDIIHIDSSISLFHFRMHHWNPRLHAISHDNEGGLHHHHHTSYLRLFWVFSMVFLSFMDSYHFIVVNLHSILFKYMKSSELYFLLIFHREMIRWSRDIWRIMLTRLVPYILWFYDWWLFDAWELLKYEWLFHCITSQVIINSFYDSWFKNRKNTIYLFSGFHIVEL